MHGEYIRVNLQYWKSRKFSSGNSLVVKYGVGNLVINLCNYKKLKNPLCVRQNNAYLKQETDQAYQLTAHSNRGIHK